jgi:hypothetical protein
VTDGDRPKKEHVHPPEENKRAGPERRASRRTPVAIPVEIHIGDRGLTTRGTTVNLSRTGALVSLRYPIEVGEHCTVQFPMAGPGLVSAVSATVLRVEKMADGNLVALEFDDELPAAPGLR